MKTGYLSNLTMLRRGTFILGAVGLLWGGIVVLATTEVIGRDSFLTPVDGRTGFGIGLGMVATWIVLAAGVALTLKYPSLSTALVFTGACAGFFLVGAPWIGPGALLAVASWFTLLAIPNPFQAELDREAAAREAAATPQE